MKKLIIRILPLALLPALFLLGSCRKNTENAEDCNCNGTEEELQAALHEEYVAFLTANDTTEVLRLCSEFMTSLKEDRFDDAVANIYALDSLGAPRHLDEQEIASFRKRTRVFPVIDFRFDSLTFTLPTDNSVTYTVDFNRADPSATVGYGLCPVLVDEKWYLTFLQK